MGWGPLVVVGQSHFYGVHREWLVELGCLCTCGYNLLVAWIASVYWYLMGWPLLLGVVPKFVESLAIVWKRLLESCDGECYPFQLCWRSRGSGVPLLWGAMLVAGEPWWR